MPYYKDAQDKIHFLSAADVARGGAAMLPDGCVEISDAEAQAAIAAQNAPDNAAEMARYLAEFKALRFDALNRLAGQLGDALLDGRSADAAALGAARQGLKDMTAYPTVLAATTGDEMRIALKNRYYEISAALYAAAPAEYVAFKALDL